MRQLNERQSTKTPKSKNSMAQAKTSPARITKIDRLITMLTRPDGATIAQMRDVTGWQSHSIRGALAGALRKKGIEVTSDVAEGTRRYRIGATK